MHKMRWRLGLDTRPCWGAYRAPPNPQLVSATTFGKTMTRPRQGVH